MKGRLQCVGTSMHLKQKYGEGYTITVNTHRDAKDVVVAADSATVAIEGSEAEPADITISSLDRFIVGEVANGHGSNIAVVNNTRKYRIEKDNRSIADIFMMMESNKAKFEIREWGISMATLEEVFISAVEKATANENNTIAKK